MLSLTHCRSTTSRGYCRLHEHLLVDATFTPEDLGIAGDLLFGTGRLGDVVGKLHCRPPIHLTHFAHQGEGAKQFTPRFTELRHDHLSLRMTIDEVVREECAPAER